MRASIRFSGIAVTLAATLSLTGCEGMETGTPSFLSVGSSTGGKVASCDPGYSLSGFFDKRPEILIDRPAEYPQAGELKRIAVVAPTGEEGEAFTESFERTLTSIKVGGQPYFQVVARNDLDEVMKEQGIGRSSSIQTGTAARLGRVLGVDGIYIPQILKYDVNDEKYQPADQRGARCTRRTATFKAVPKLVDVETGQIVYSQEIGGTREDRYCENGGGLLDGKLSAFKSTLGVGGQSDQGVMMSAIIDAAMIDFANDVAPQSCSKKMNIMEAMDGFSSEGAASEFDGGVAFMKTGRYDRACPAWRSLEARGEATVALYNNLSLCAEIDNKLTKARQYCGKADALLTRPDENINLCLDNIDKRLVEAAASRGAGCGARLTTADIREVQQILIDKGYLDDAVNGQIGPSTLSAVIDFQTDNALPVEGEVDGCLLNDLRDL